MNSTLVQTLLTFAARRGLTVLGGSASSISDNDLTQFLGVLTVIVNELIQFLMAHKSAKQKAETVKIGS